MPGAQTVPRSQAHRAAGASSHCAVPAVSQELGWESAEFSGEPQHDPGIRFTF